MAIEPGFIKGIKLYAPPSYWRCSTDELNAVTGGCGPGGKGDYLVPDTMYGLSVFRACQIHDYMYYEGKTQEDKEKADRAFLNNMVRIINAETKWKWLRSLRKCRARTYYTAVRYGGGGSFWDGKNRPETFDYVEEPERDASEEP